MVENECSVMLVPVPFSADSYATYLSICSCQRVTFLRV